MPLAEEDESFLHPQRDRLVVAERAHQRTDRRHRPIDRGVRPAVRSHRAQEHVELRDQLRAEQVQLLIDDVARF